MPLLRRLRSITHAQKNHDAVKLSKKLSPKIDENAARRAALEFTK
jgi:hypothetical protein